MNIQTINPATEEVINTYLLWEKKQIHAAIEAAHLSYRSWRKTAFNHRRQLMLNMAKLLRLKQDEYAHLMATEMGKPISAGKAEIEKCAWVCEHYAEQAESYLASESITTEKARNVICYQPLGVVFAIMPWNFPFWQVFRFAAPTIMAGNAAILKHAPISTGTGEAIAALFLEAGFPPALFQHFILDNELAAEVIAHEKIVALSLTGSERAGQAVASQAGKYLKKVVLELGGNDPYVVFADAHLAMAAECIVKSRLNNNGQVCIAAKRIIVETAIADKLITQILELIKQYPMGSPLSASTLLGPLARQDLRDNLHQQVRESIKKGAKLLLGGEIPSGPGYYYPPTVLANVSPGMPAFDDELFGPVFCIIRADNEAHAIALANDSRYGLSAALFTHDVARGERIAREDIETGTCAVNALVASDPRLPFGGIKCSGFGRELAKEGITAFMNVKTIVTNKE